MGVVPDPRYQPEDAEIIKKKAKRLVGHYGYRQDDVDDLEQELALHVFPRIHLHRPERGSREGFVGKMASNKLLNVIEQRTAQKRDRRYDTRIDDAGEDALNDGSTSQDRIDLQIDMRQVLARMPADLHKVALLRTQHSERELEGLLHLTRAEVRTRIAKVEKFLRDAGLDPDASD
jgi:hypothetical protein